MHRDHNKTIFKLLKLFLMKKIIINILVLQFVMLLASSCQRDDDQEQEDISRSVLVDELDTNLDDFYRALKADGATIKYDTDGTVIVTTPLYVGTEEYIKTQEVKIIEELGLDPTTAKQTGLSLLRWLAMQDDCGGHTEARHFDKSLASLQNRMLTDPNTNVATSFWFFGKNSIGKNAILSSIKWGYDLMKRNNLRQWAFMPSQVEGNNKILGGGYDGNSKNPGKPMTGVKYLNLNIARANVGGGRKCFLQTAFPSDKANKRREARFDQHDEVRR